MAAQSSKILDIAKALRGGDGASAIPAFWFGTNDTPISNSLYDIYAVRFPDDKDTTTAATWAIRIPSQKGSNTLPPESITAMMEAEMGILAELNDKGFPWSPG
ncbi:hypothetical protein PG993_003184 [Apiospora rasikravindrae]|uniref:Uncharacterized protein n=1 Tax=Apiospora rasikravindrae TaxID=990691 RepID=A0ABR1U1J7_9PEZI